MKRSNLLIFFASLLLSTPLWVGANVLQDNVESALIYSVSPQLQTGGASVLSLPNKQDTLDIEATAAGTFMINPETGRSRFIEKKNLHEVLPIASITKLMTALIVWENSDIYDFQRVVTISKEAANREDVPVYGNLKEGDERTVEELVELILVYSSNHAAHALADVALEEEFVKKMNEKAKSIGMKNTNFDDPSGISFLNQSTIQDLAIFGEYLLFEKPFIYELSNKAKLYAIPNGIDSFRQEYNVIGGKTGYTDEAGGCLFIVTQHQGRYFINIVLGSKDAQNRVLQMERLLSITHN